MLGLLVPIKWIIGTITLHWFRSDVEPDRACLPSP